MLLFGGLPVPAAFAGIDMVVPTDPKSPIQVEVRRLFDEAPPAGYAPMRLKISNWSTQRGRWVFQFKATSSHYAELEAFESSFSLIVESGSAGIMEFMVPLPKRDRSAHQYTQVEMHVSGPAVSGGHSTSFSSTYSRYERSPYTLIGSQIALIHLPGIKKDLEAKSIEWDGSQVEREDFASSWRAYTGVAQIWLTENEWTSLEVSQRDAVRDWVAQGGRLIVLGRDASQARQALASTFGLDFRQRDLTLANAKWNDEVASYGAGEVRVHQAEVKRLLAEEIAAAIRALGAPWNPERMNEDFEYFWGLSALVDAISNRAGFLLMFIFCFAILVGPVNLFVFAKGDKRYRLFWTTPLISVAASFFLWMIIVFSDGFGGDGRRMVMCILMPNQPRMIVLQEQISRTAVLWGTSFAISQPTAIAPVQFNSGSSPSTRTLPSGRSLKPLAHHQTRRRSVLTAQRYFEHGDLLSGDWFRSRAVQGAWLQEVRPTRAKIELIPSQDGPILVSSISQTLDRFYYLDAEGAFYTASKVAPGVRTPLKESSREDHERFLDDLYTLAGGRIKPVLDEARGRLDHYVATVLDDETEAIQTLRTINWNTSPAVFLGRPDRLPEAAARPLSSPP
jgi:hypothetical protein